VREVTHWNRLARELVSCGCPLTGSVQGQVGQGFEQPDLVESILAHGSGGWNQMVFKVPLNTNHPMIL